ncbi:MAG: hypothetical protein QXM54_02640 [Desulfurococcaceae archaeon]|uniref:Uncharacterized protein n=1 Tax=Staphylothermus marinus TaxID=2280 RepID=A0A7C4JL80_STAMA
MIKLRDPDRFRELINRLTTGKRVLISHYINAKLALSKAVIDSLLLRDMKILVVDENLYMTKYGLLESETPNLTYVQKNSGFNKNTYVDLALFIEPNFIPKPVFSQNILVTVTPKYRLRIPKYYSISYLKKIVGNKYFLEFRDYGERFRIIVSGLDIDVADDKPHGLLGTILDVLRRSMLEYGELSVKDAVNIVHHELGLENSVARRMIYRLASEKYLEIRKGRVIVY